MATETLYATSLVSGAVSTSGNALGAPNGTWTTDADNTSWTARFAMGNPTGNSANGTHTVTLRVRKETGSGTPTVTSIRLYAGATDLGTIGAGGWSVTSTTGEDITATFADTLIDGFDLSTIDVEIVTAQSGGGPSARSCVQLDGITWSGDFTTVPPSGTSTGSYTFTGSATGSAPAVPGSVTLDRVIAGGQVDASQSLTFSATVGDNPNRLLLVGVSVGELGDTGAKPPTATFNGTSMNLVATKQSNSDATTDGYVALFSLVAPAVTTANVVVSIPGAETAEIQGGAISLYGVDQTTPLGTAASANGNSQSVTSVTVPGVDSGNMAVNVVCAGTSLTTTNSHTDAWLQNNDAGSAASNCAGQYATGAGADITMTWNITATEWWASIGVEVLAVGIPSGTGTGSYTFTGATVTGSATHAATGTGSYTFTGATVTGSSPNEGTSTGSYILTGSATGDAPANSGTTTGSYAFAGSATGARAAQGTASGSYTESGSATGARAAQGTATGSYTESGSATGARTSDGTSSGAYDFTGSSTGSRAPEGTATGSYAFSGSAIGSAPSVGGASGTASGSFAFSGSSTGSAPVGGSATGTFEFAGTGTGTSPTEGAATGSYTLTGSATGSAPAVGGNGGTATGSFTHTGSATGSTTKSGTTTGSFALTCSAATGSSPTSGTGTGSYDLSGSASGAMQPQGTATGSVTYTGSAVSSGVNSGTATGSYGFVYVRDITVTATILDAAWSGSIEESPRSATVLASTWEADVVDAPWDADVNAARWRATL